VIPRCGIDPGTIDGLPAILIVPPRRDDKRHQHELYGIFPWYLRVSLIAQAVPMSFNTLD
jgi:hypothetical protein